MMIYKIMKMFYNYCILKWLQHRMDQCPLGRAEYFNELLKDPDQLITKDAKPFDHAFVTLLKKAPEYAKKGMSFELLFEMMHFYAPTAKQLYGYYTPQYLYVALPFNAEFEDYTPDLPITMYTTPAEAEKHAIQVGQIYSIVAFNSQTLDIWASNASLETAVLARRNGIEIPYQKEYQDGNICSGMMEFLCSIPYELTELSIPKMYQVIDYIKRKE